MEKYRIPNKYKIPFFSPINRRFKKMYNDWIKIVDNKLPMELGLLLEDLHENDQYIFGFHKTSASKNMKIDIFQNGLITNDSNVESTVALDHHYPLTLCDIYGSIGMHGGRCFNGGFLIVIPKRDLGLTEETPEPIYYHARKKYDNNNYGLLERRLKPEYIQAFISVEENEMQDRQFKIELKSDYEKYFDPNKKMNYLQEDLEYDEKAKEKINEIKR